MSQVIFKQIPCDILFIVPLEFPPFVAREPDNDGLPVFATVRRILNKHIACTVFCITGLCVKSSVRNNSRNPANNSSRSVRG